MNHANGTYQMDQMNHSIEEYLRSRINHTECEYHVPANESRLERVTILVNESLKLKVT